MRLKKYVFPLVVALTAAAHAAGPEVKYKAPRTADGHPDAQSSCNVSSNVPLELPSIFADRKTATREEIEKNAQKKENALKMARTFAPVEAVGIEALDHTSHVDDLRTSLITYPENGRMPALADGATRVLTVDQILDAIGDPKAGPPPGLAQFLMPQARDSHQNFSPAERCLIGAPSVPIQPDLT